MLAWLQRAWVMVLLAVTFAVGTWLHGLGLPWWLVVPLSLLVFNLHAWLLAWEFAWLSRLDPGEGIVRPSPAMLMGAWWGEIRAGLLTFCWRQPFRTHAVDDRLSGSAAPRRGVLLVHGFVCNRALWNPWMRRLAAADVPYLAINLEPVFASIDRYVEAIDAAVHRLEAQGGLAPVVVAHSMGGLAVRAWLRDRAADRRVHSIVTIGTPHRGTRIAKLAVTPNARQMRPNNPWLLALHAQESAARRALFTCFFSHCDNIVFPASLAVLPGADNRHVEGVAHVDLAFERTVFDEVLRRVDLPVEEPARRPGVEG